MKKIIIILYLTLITGLVSLYFYGNSKKIDHRLFTIRENISVVYEKNRTMTFNVYSEIKDPMIIYPEHNSYTLRLDKLSFTLENVGIEVIDGFDINIIKIKANMPNLTNSELYSKTCYLDIVNADYSILLDLGTFSYLNSDYYKKIELDHLSGSFSYIDDYFNLVGINLTLSKNYEYMTSFRIGSYAIGMISKTKTNLSYDNEINIYDIIPSYIDTKIDKNYVYGIRSKMMFIPMGYIKSYLTRSGYIIITLDNVNYYFDDFPYMTTDPIFTKYKNYLIEGEKYA